MHAGPDHLPTQITSEAELRARFDLIRAITRDSADVPWSVRDTRLANLEALIRDGRSRLTAAIAGDFGQRPAAETELAELFPTLDMIRDARRQGSRWMRPRKVPTAVWFRPGRTRLRPQPLGVIGIIAPWNYPLMLSAGPLVSAFAAGNRAMLKLSEFAPAFATCFAELAAERFSPDELTVVQGGPDMAAAFAALPFDHLLFTGSTGIGRKVMAAAAPNLTPVTLELGGKSPALVGPDARLDHAAARIMAGKMLNAGQTCIAPDYVLVPRDRIVDFIHACRSWVDAHYPALASSQDYATIISARQFQRLRDWLDAAQAGGATLHPLSDAGPDPARRLLPPVIVTDPAGPLTEDEIFGPVLPVLPYDRVEDAIAHIVARPRPLAFYPFTDDRVLRERLLNSVVAGGVTINDTLLHVAQPALPFGGVGDSGMGAYHGKMGFDRMSHLLPVFSQARWNGAHLMAPPYGARFRTLMNLMLR